MIQLVGCVCWDKYERRRRRWWGGGAAFFVIVSLHVNMSVRVPANQLGQWDGSAALDLSVEQTDRWGEQLSPSSHLVATGTKKETERLILDGFFCPLTVLSCSLFNGQCCGGIPSLSCCRRSSLVVLGLEASPPLSIILTAAWSFLLAWFSILWQQTFLVVALWPPATLLHCTGNRAYSQFHPRLCPAIQFVFPTPGIFWWQWSMFMAVLMSSHFCLSLISQGTAYRKMNYTTQWKGWMSCSQVKANLPQHDLVFVSSYSYTAGDLPVFFRNNVFLLCSTRVNYVLPVRSWRSHVVCQVYPWLAHKPKIAYQVFLH